MRRSPAVVVARLEALRERPERVARRLVLAQLGVGRVPALHGRCGEQRGGEREAEDHLLDEPEVGLDAFA